MEDAVAAAGQKHVLEHRWTMWFGNPSVLTKRGHTLRPFCTFGTAEDFWCLLHNMRTPGQHQPSASFALFKDSIEPLWEDPKNAHGGCWVVEVPKTASAGSTRSPVDDYWLNVVLACIGEQFSHGNEISGVAVNRRHKGDRIELWTRTGTDEAAQIAIGKQLRTLLDVPSSTRITYGLFSERISVGNRAKERYTL